MSVNDQLVKSDKPVWCLADANRSFLMYALYGGRFQLDLSHASSRFAAKWFNPGTGEITDAVHGPVQGGDVISFTASDERDWVLWVDKMQN